MTIEDLRRRQEAAELTLSDLLTQYDMKVLQWVFVQARNMQGAFIEGEYQDRIRRIDRLEAKIFSKEGIEPDDF